MRISVLEPQEQRLQQRLVAYIIGCGGEGAKRTDLIKRFNLKAEKLDEALSYLRQQDGFEDRTQATSGRPSHHYIYQPDPNKFEDGGRRCIWCATVTPEAEWYQPVRYCGDICRTAAMRAGATPRHLLQNAEGGPQRMAVATYLVAADLGSRGWSIYWPMNPYGGVLYSMVIAKGTQVLSVQVHPTTRALSVDRARLADVVALVFEGGRVTYQGLTHVNSVENTAQKEGGPV